MAMTYVPFDRYAELLRPDFTQEHDEVVRAVEAIVTASVEGEGHGRALRDAHAKSYGLLRARLTISDDIPAEYAQGIYAAPAQYDAVIRLTNGLGHLRPDRALGAACGMGIKLFGVPGLSLLDEEKDAGTLDYSFINNPTFFCNTARDYRYILPLFDSLPDALATPQSRRRYMHDFLTCAGTLPPEQWLWDELLAFLSFAAVPRKNLLLYSYWSMSSYRHGNYIARLRATPTPGSASSVAHPNVDVAAEDEPYRRTLVAETAERDHAYDLQVQLCADLENNPVDNTAVAWPESIAPFVTVARLDIPAQDISSPSNLEKADATSITPWRTREEHRPLGEINQLRREVYRRSSILRHGLNSQERREPTSPQDALT